MIIYKHTSIDSGKSYIGWTCYSMDHRWKGHLRESNKGSNTHFHNAIRKYGTDNWKHEILDKSEYNEEILQLEIYYIEKYDTVNSGYNMTIGGSGGNTISKLDDIQLEKFKNKCSLASKKYWNNISKEDWQKRSQRAEEWNLNIDRSYMTARNKKYRGVGEKNPCSKLNDSDVRAIKILINNKKSLTKIANQYSVSVTVISNIKLGKSWSHIKC